MQEREARRVRGRGPGAVGVVAAILRELREELNSGWSELRTGGRRVERQLPLHPAKHIGGPHWRGTCPPPPHLGREFRGGSLKVREVCKGPWALISANCSTGWEL